MKQNRVVGARFTLLQPSVNTEESWLEQWSTAFTCRKLLSSGMLQAESPKIPTDLAGKSYTGRRNKTKKPQLVSTITI